MAEITYIEAIRQGIWEEMERDERVVMLGEDIGAFGGAFKVSAGMLERFGPERIIETPISESGFTGAAIGMSFLGFRPIVEMQFIDFISCAYNMITNFAAKCRYRWGAGVPIVVRGPCGAGVRGGPFHSQSVEVPYIHTAGLKVVEPATASDAKGLIKAAIRDEDPVIFLEHKFLYRRIKETVPAGDWIVPIGQAALRRAGRDVSVITYGAMVHRALEAASLLERDGIEMEVLDLRTLRPLDVDAILATVRKTSKVFVLHEDTKTGGIAGEVAAIINERAFEDLDGPVLRLTSPDTPVPYSPPLEDAFLPSVDDIVGMARRLAAY